MSRLPAAAVAGVLLSGATTASAVVVADLANGITDYYNATFDQPLVPCGPADPAWCDFFGGKPPPGRMLALSPLPTGTISAVPAGLAPPLSAGSQLDLDVDSNTGEVTFAGGVIAFHDFTVTIAAGTAQETRFRLHGPGMRFTGPPQVAPLDADGRAEFLVNSAPLTAVDFSTFTSVITDCTGPFCALVPILTLDMVRYRLVVDYAPDFSGLTAEFIGQTGNHSMLYAVLGAVPPDGVPSAFFILDETWVPTSTAITSQPVLIEGISVGTDISVSGDPTSSYSINGGAFTSEPGVVYSDSMVQVRHVSSAAPATGVDTVLTIGGVSDTFTSTTYPFAVDDGAVSYGQMVVIDVLGNDNGLGPSVTVGVWSGPQHGSAVVSGSPGAPSAIRISYGPDSGYVGTDSFEYWVQSGQVVDYGLVSVVVSDQDPDLDGVLSSRDNCILVSNPSQCDSDQDGFGNRCDGDLNNNGVTNSQDTVLLRSRIGTSSVAPGYNAADFNCNGAINAQDTALFRQMLGTPPGPSGRAP